MRTIKFRGKRSYDKKWVYGSLLIITKEKYPQLISDMYCIIPKDEYVYYDANFMLSEMNEYNVIPETVGQFTGLTDKNGKEIFEGDIVNAEYYNHNMKNCKLTQYVSFYLGSFSFRTQLKLDVNIDETYHHAPLYFCQSPNQFEVIGNVFDNQELLTKTNL